MSRAEVLELRRMQRALDAPHVSASGRWTQRSTLELALGVRGGICGRGEAAPLPDYSPDDLSGAEGALSGLAPASLTALGDLTDARALLDAAAALVPEQQPAARFALETALLDRAGQHVGRPVWRLLSELAANAGAASAASAPPRPEPVALCALLPNGDPGAAVALARRHASLGVMAFKLKIGPDRSSRVQEATLEALRSELGAGIRLRLDANGSLSRSALGATLAQLTRYSIEFLEEPLAGAEPAELADSPCPLALDESLHGMATATLSRWLGVEALRVLVLKPTALGGFAACLRLARAARAHGKDTVVSHTLEGPIGWAACAHLALALSPARAAGLWPLAHQAAPLPRIEDGCLVPPQAAGLGAGA